MDDLFSQDQDPFRYGTRTSAWTFLVGIVFWIVILLDVCCGGENNVAEQRYWNSSSEIGETGLEDSAAAPWNIELVRIRADMLFDQYCTDFDTAHSACKLNYQAVWIKLEDSNVKRSFPSIH